MSAPDFSDPRAFRWVESGVSGLARPREWDAVVVVDLPELADLALDAVAFRCHRRGELVGDEDVPEHVLAALDAAVAGTWDERPYEAQAVRDGPTRWSVGIREHPGELVRLPAGLDPTALQVAVSPEGDRSYRVDGHDVGGDLWAARVGSLVVEALETLESLGARRFQAYVVGADRVEGDLWEVRVDPL